MCACLYVQESETSEAHSTRLQDHTCGPDTGEASKKVQEKGTFHVKHWFCSPPPLWCMFLSQRLFNKSNPSLIKNKYTVKKSFLDLFTAESTNLIKITLKVGRHEAVARRALGCPWEREPIIFFLSLLLS